MADTATEIVIASTVLTSTASSIIFSGIPNTYTDLRIVLVGRTDFSDTESAHGIQFNTDTASNYSHIWLYGDGTSAISTSYTNVSGSSRIGYLPAANSTSGILGVIAVDIFSYAGNTYKTLLSQDSHDLNGSGKTLVNVGLWSSTSAITSIKLYDRNSANYVAGTIATLYGVL